MNFPSGKIKKLYKYFIVLDCFLLFFIIFQLYFSKYYWEGDNDKRFIVTPGNSLDEIINDLKNEGIIPDKFLFKIVVKLSGKESQIISNTYNLKNGMSSSQLLSILTDRNYSQLIRFTVPPGYNIRQIGKLAEKKLFLSKEIFYKEASNDSLINLIGLKGQVENLEGFLYPDSYDVQPSISESGLVLLLFNEFRKKILENTQIDSFIKARNTDLLKTVTLGSIIEGETQIENEKSVIAGVYLNRISKGMRLEADPTIQYILPDGPKKRLLYEDLKINSPYNTYLHKGLPPGPVNNPAITTIRAALNPAEHKFLFFVATGEGGHKFSENYSDHLNAVREYRERLKKDSVKEQ